MPSRSGLCDTNISRMLRINFQGSPPNPSLQSSEHGAQTGPVIVQEVVVTGDVDVASLTPPHLQNVSTDSIIIIMCENQQHIPLSVTYGTHGAFDQTEDMTRVSSGGGSWFYRVLLENLEPGHEHEYRIVVTGGEAQSEDAVFRTAPLCSPDFKFSLWSDSQARNTGSTPRQNWTTGNPS